jgi:hypothetical protein
MTEYQYTTVPGKLEEFLSKIRQIGVPSKTTYKWLESVGFKSTNDRSLIRVLKFIGFIDDSRSPTELWQKYRGKNHQQILAQGVQQGYRELFEIYPDAHERSSEELESYFSTQSTAGKQVISKTVSTFQTLCGLADFKSAVPTATELVMPTKISPKPVEEEQQTQTDIPSQLSPSLHIDIQIHISSGASADQIDQIFASMAKHLYKTRE